MQTSQGSCASSLCAESPRLGMDGGERNQKVHNVSNGTTESIVKGQVTEQVSGTETVGTRGETAGKDKGAVDGARAAERRGVEQTSSCGRNGGHRGCLGKSDRVQKGVPGAGGVRGALRHTHRRLAKELCYSKLHMGKSWAWRQA